MDCKTTSLTVSTYCSRTGDVNEIFQFDGAPPSWNNLEAELVALHRIDTDKTEENLARHCQASGPSVALGTNAKSPESTLSWLAHDSNASICFPRLSMGLVSCFSH